LSDKRSGEESGGVGVVEQLVLADDLSGASEAAAAFLLRTTRIRVDCAADSSSASTPARVVAVDLDTRTAPADRVALRVAGVLCGGAPERVLVKVDSLLRGDPGRLVEAVRHALGAAGSGCHAHRAGDAEERSAATGLPVATVVCAATPQLGRTSLGGVVHVDGRPLHESSLWHAEARPAPRSAAEALEQLDVRPVPLSLVRGPRAALVRALRETADNGCAALCDAEVDEDLDALVAACDAMPGRTPLLVGAGGLAAAAARALPPDAGGHPRSTPPRPGQILVVVGSAAPGLRAEVADLVAAGAQVVDLPVAELLRTPRQATVPAPTAPVTVVRPAAAPVDPAASRRLVGAFADAVADAARSADDTALVLTGGETARAVLDRLGTRYLRPVHADRGAVTAVTDDNRTVVTRPGSFGGATSLATIVSNLTHRPLEEPS
jgi:4-hydroxythreonine-4-phosphate dehydrogenase